MKYLVTVVALVLFNAGAWAGDIDVVDQRYIDQLSRGGMVSVKQAAQSIYNTGERDTEVLDVAAEVLSSRYATASSSDIDSPAGVGRAIGASGNGRYHSALSEVANSGAHKKLRKYASNALSEVGGATGSQYQRGTVNLASLRSGSSSSSSSTRSASSSSSSSGKAGLNVIKVGMSMQEVYDLIGQPSATTTHQTGKAWIPFNYGAKDLARTHLLYKGKGRVVCSHDGYSSTSRVLEVIIDPAETGYP